MRILLIGMNGFLGRNLAKKLEFENVEILSIVKKEIFRPKNFKTLIDDISNLKVKSLNRIKKFKPHVVINLAWQGIPDYSFKNSLINFSIHLNFFQKIISIKSIRKIIMIGSSWEYLPNSGICSENYKQNNTKPFVWSKNSIYQYIKKHTIKKKIDFIWLRVFFMYGKYQKKESLMPYIISQLKKNQKPKLLSPNSSNDFIHVDDVCRALILVIKKKKISGIFNVGCGKQILVRDIYKLILNRLSKRGSKYQLNVKLNKNKKDNYANISKICSKLNWKPEIKINEGINKIISI